MIPEDAVEIWHRLSDHCRHRAAELYYEAFRQKFEPMMVSQAHGVAILEKSFNPELAIVAMHQDQLAGVAGLQYGGRHFVDFGVADFVREFGWLRGPLRFLPFLAFVRNPREGELLMDGIVVDAAMRGQGLGTRLLQAAFDFAEANGFDAVRLDVVNTNPGARRLYERMGFAPVKTRNYPFLRDVMGFSASTTMIKKII